MPQRFIPIQGSTSPDQQLNIINKNFAELDNENTTKLFYGTDGLPSISIGVQQDKTSRIRIARAGIDVTTATDAQLAFNSAQNVLKVVRTGTVTVPQPSVAVNNNVNRSLSAEVIIHDLGYVPLVIAFWLDLAGTEYRAMPFSSTGTVGITTVGNFVQTTMSFEADTTSVIFTSDILVSYSGSGTFSGLGGGVKYYLLQETAN